MRRMTPQPLTRPLGTLTLGALTIGALTLGALTLGAAKSARAQFKPGARTYTEEVAGVYRGDYECEGRRHPLLIDLPARGDAVVYGLYEGREPLSFTAEVLEVQGRRHMRVELHPRRWLSRPSGEFEMMTLSGKLRGDHLEGRVKVEGCGRFDVTLLSCPDAASCGTRALGVFAEHRDLLEGEGRGRRGGGRYGERRDDLRDDRRGDRRDDRRGDRRAALGMEPAAFSALLAQAQGASFDKDRFQILAVAAPNNPFTSAQVADLLRVWTFDPQRLEALALLAPRIEDPANSHVILMTFSFDAHKAKASALLAGAGAGAGVSAGVDAGARAWAPRGGRAALGRRGGGAGEMSAVEFAALKKQISDASFDHERDAVLKLASQSNYFSCAQAAELLGEWSFDPQRLAALEVLAPRLVDTEQRHMLLDSFDFDSNKARAAEILGGH